MKNEEVKDNFKAKGLAKAKEVLDYLKCSEKERQEYERYKEFLHAQASMYESTYVVGKIEGKAEEKLEIAKSMLAEGFDVKTIVKITGLTAEIILQ